MADNRELTSGKSDQSAQVLCTKAAEPYVCMYVCMYVCKTIYTRRIKNKELLKRRSFKRTSKFSAVLGTVQLSCPAVAVWLVDYSKVSVQRLGTLCPQDSC